MAAEKSPWNKKDVDEEIKKFNNRNSKNLTDFSTKQVILIFHKETKEDINKIHKKLGKHIEQGEKQLEKLLGYIIEHDKLIAYITDALPEKGFCEKVDKTLYTAKGEDKVEILWNDRRWIKYLSMAGFGAIITGVVMIGVSLVT